MQEKKCSNMKTPEETFTGMSLTSFEGGVQA